MDFKLSCIRRDVNENLFNLRKSGVIPAVIYGAKLEKNINLKLKRLDFEKAFAVAGEFSLIDLSIDDKESSKVIVKDVQYDPIKRMPLHVDFYQVDMTQKIETSVPLNFMGVSRAVKDLGGVLTTSISEIEIECMPADLISHIDVDISVLDKFDDMIRVKDLIVPENIHILNNVNDAVISVSELRVEAEEAKPEEAAPSADEKKAESTEAASATEEAKGKK